MRYRPLSIKREGLEKYLNRTSNSHNGFGYAEFIKLTEAKVTVTNLAKAFKVNRITITKWLNIHSDKLSRTEKQTKAEVEVESLRDV